MPALGSSEPRRRATAYAHRGSGGLPSLYMVLAGLVSLFVLKNVLFTDYRQETIDALKQAGQSEMEIERFVPKTAAERAQYVKDKRVDYEQLKKDVAYLLSEVDDLKTVVESIRGTAAVNNTTNKNSSSIQQNTNADTATKR